MSEISLSWKETWSLSLPDGWVLLCLFFCLAVPTVHRGNPSLVSKVSGVEGVWGVFTIEASVFCLFIGQKKQLYQFKSRRRFLPPFLDGSTPKHRTYREGLTQSCRKITRVGFRMPAYSTNMRLKFPILALILEIITIILYAVFVTYDDGHGHHDDHHKTNGTEKSPLDLYPSKWCWWMLFFGFSLLT